MSYNAEVTADDVVDPRGVESVQKTMQQLCDLFECADAEAACDRIRALITSLGLPASLTELGICSSQDLHKICDNVNLQRLANNPRRLDADSLSAVIQKAA
jgi:alcohol dehydrogenase class IV